MGRGALTFWQLRCRVTNVQTVRLALVPPIESTDRSADGALCRAFLAGDTEAFGELCRRHEETVFRLVRRYATSTDDAMDLTQRAFLQALEAAERALPRLLATDEVPFRAWLLRIAINLGKNHVRDHGRWPRAKPGVLEAEPARAPSASEVLERAQVERLMRKAVVDLPRRQREVFTLRVDGALPFAEVAATLGITEGNAKAHFHHAAKRLREVVQQAMTGASHDDV
jgi:RNA polymerase sigma-70 factor (ECF subfamily)